MTDLDAFAIGEPGPATANGAGPRRHRHRWAWGEQRLIGQPPITVTPVVCALCGRHRDEVRARRGRTARARGNAAEVRLAHRYGGKRVGQYGGAEDVVVSGLFVIQSKHGRAYYSERYARWLAALPRSEGRVPVLIVGDGSPGRHARRLVVLDERDWLDLHGEDAP